jgi:predicted ATPase
LPAANCVLPTACPVLQHVTFVSGTNGSGKSAVLQALQCCLGVKASNTGRANSFKKVGRLAVQCEARQARRAGCVALH